MSSAADHVALSLGDGKCLSTDINGVGTISVALIDDISRRWNGHLLGWTEDLNGYRVYSPPAPKPEPKPTPRITAVLQAKTLEEKRAALRVLIDKGDGGRGVRLVAKRMLRALNERTAAREEMKRADAEAAKARSDLRQLERK
jgi:hypothetical protein